MNKWYKVGCSKCGAMITSLELGKTVVGFHDPLDEVKYEQNIITRVEHNGTIKSILCPNCAGDSFDSTKYCTTYCFYDCLMDKRGLFDYDSQEGLAACKACKASWLLKEENNGSISNI